MTRVVRHRRAVDGGYARGEETRARIVAAAMTLFGERGFAGTSIRDIAASAGVCSPALQYYFENKDGVYRACAEDMASRAWEYLSGVVERAERALADNEDYAVLIEAYCAIQARTVEMMFKALRTGHWRLFMAKDQVGLGPPSGFQTVSRRVSARIYTVTAAIVARLLGQATDDEETAVRAMALSGQLLFFSMRRSPGPTALNWQTIEGDRLELIQRILKEQTVVLLRSMRVKQRA